MPEPSLSRATTPTYANELDDYLQSPWASMKTNPAEFWNKYPHLTKLAREVLGVPSLSASVECLFSIAGKLYRSERFSLKDEHFKQLMIIWCNN